MVKKSMQISCPHGLEPRPIAELVQVASKYDSKVYLETETKRVNAKSIMGMMSMDLYNGDFVTLSTDGNDEDRAMEELQSFMTSRLNMVSMVS